MAFSGTQKTRLGLSGIPRSLYGSFTGRQALQIASIDQDRQRDIQGLSRSRSLVDRIRVTTISGRTRTL